MANKKQTVKIFKVWMELDNAKAFAENIPAKTEKQAKEYCAGNGEIIAVNDVTEQATKKVENALRLLYEHKEEHAEAYDILRRLYEAVTEEQINF